MSGAPASDTSHPMRWTWLLLLLSSVMTPLHARELPLAACPDEKIEAVFKTLGPDDFDGVDEVIFRIKATGKKIASFPEGGFGTGNPQMLWSPDGRLAALVTRTTRHTAGITVYHVTAEEVRAVKMEDYTQNIYGRLGILHGTGAEAHLARKWLAADRLLIYTRGSLGNEDFYEYEVEVLINPDGGNFTGWLEKITDVKKKDE